MLRKFMKIPIKVKIGAHEFVVREVKFMREKDEDYGNMWIDQGFIEIDKDIMQSLKEETFFHEVGHAIGQVTGVTNGMDKEEEEKFIQSFMHGVYLFLKENNLLKEEL